MVSKEMRQPGGVTWYTAGNHKEIFYPALEFKLITSYASRQIKNVNVDFCIINSFLFLKTEFCSSQQKQVEKASIFFSKSYKHEYFQGSFGFSGFYCKDFSVIS